MAVLTQQQLCKKNTFLLDTAFGQRQQTARQKGQHSSDARRRQPMALTLIAKKKTGNPSTINQQPTAPPLRPFTFKSNLPFQGFNPSHTPHHVWHLAQAERNVGSTTRIACQSLRCTGTQHHLSRTAHGKRCRGSSEQAVSWPAPARRSAPCNP